MFIENKGKQAGLLYFLIALVGFTSMLYLPSKLFIDGNPSLTFNNIIEKEALFNMMLAGDICIFILEMILVSTLNIMFKQVNYQLSLIAMLARYAMVIIMGVNVMFFCGMKMLVGGNAYFR